MKTIEVENGNYREEELIESAFHPIQGIKIGTADSFYHPDLSEDGKRCLERVGKHVHVLESKVCTCSEYCDSLHSLLEFPDSNQLYSITLMPFENRYCIADFTEVEEEPKTFTETDVLRLLSIATFTLLDNMEEPPLSETVQQETYGWMMEYVVPQLLERFGGTFTEMI